MLATIVTIIVVCYAIKGVAIDLGAVGQKKTPPSHEKWLKRHERKVAKQQTSDPAPSYGKRILGNALEEWATRSDQRHRRRMDALAEVEPEKREKHLERIRAKREKKHRAGGWLAKLAGMSWKRRRDDPDQTFTDALEDEAWDANEARDKNQPPEPETDSEEGGDQDATIFVFPDVNSRNTDTTNDTDGTDTTDDDTDDVLPTLNGDPMTDAAGTTEDTVAGAEATTLGEARTFTSKMSTSLAQIQSQLDTKVAELTELSKSATTGSQQLETFLASLEAKGAEGDYVTELTTAMEKLTAISTAADTASSEVSSVIETANTGKQSFDSAYLALQGQTGIAEHMQAAAASGNRAVNDRGYYENG